MIEGKRARELLAQHLTEIGTAKRIAVVVASMVEMDVKGRMPRQDAKNVVFTSSETLLLSAVTCDVDAQGGRGDFKLAMTPVSPLTTYKTVLGSVNKDGRSLIFKLDDRTIGSFDELCNEVLRTPLNDAGVTARDVIKAVIQRENQATLVNGAGTNEDYGTW